MDEPSIDRTPRTHEEWTAFAALPPAERAAVYLRSLRAMLMLFGVVAAIGLSMAIVFAVVGIHAVDEYQQPSPVGPYSL